MNRNDDGESTVPITIDFAAAFDAEMPEPLSDATATVGERVRSRRQELGFSQETLADRSGVHWTFIGQLERGRRNVSLHNLLKVAAGLEIDPGENQKSRTMS